MIKQIILHYLNDARISCISESSGSTSKSETPVSSVSKPALSTPTARSASPAPPPSTPAISESESIKSDVEVEKKLLLVLCDISLDIPSNASVLATETSKLLCRQVKLSAIEHLLEKFAAQQLIRLVQSQKANIKIRERKSLCTFSIHCRTFACDHMPKIWSSMMCMWSVLESKTCTWFKAWIEM